jgi:transglutaminase-like putative cysteine protease
MRLTGYVLAVSALAASAASTFAQGRFNIAPVPDWVEPIEAEVPETPPAKQLSAGIYWLLSERQVRVGTGSRESYGHYAKQVVNDAGLESASQVSVDFDPSFQRLTLHSVRVRRDGVWKSRLRARAVRLLQRERELESQMYDGRVSALLFVEDLRAGDILDYAYTISGANPIFAGRYLDAFASEWNVPLHRMRFRLLWPAKRQVFIRNHRTTLAPVTRERGAYSEHIWERDDPPPIGEDSGVPAWFDSYGWVQLSEFESWTDVARWGRGLFASTPDVSAALETQVDAWRRLPPEAAVQAALRFVQDEIRYLGIELGIGSHQPSAPAIVLGRRFGDCKDKVLLFCSLLRAVGIEARPVLVHASAGQALDEWHPSPFAFNHVVARVDFADGRRVWVDPTLTAQGGTLDDTWFPDYGRGLVLESETAGLIEIPRPKLARPSVHVQETYRAKDFRSPVEYDVTTRYEGRDAERLRRDFRHRSRSDIAQGYLEFYSRSWPGINRRGEVDLSDDRAANVVTTIERYTIPNFWTTPRFKERPEAELWANEVESVVGNPERTGRWAPFGLAHPLYVRQSTRVELPEEWNVAPEAASIADAAVRFGFRSARAGKALSLEYDYQTLTNAVSAAEYAEHMKVLDRVRSRLSFRLRRPLLPGATATRTNWTVWLIFASCALFAALGAIVVYRREAPAGAGVVRAPSLRGVRGWLLLFAACVAAILLSQGTAIWTSRGDYALATWLERTTPSGDTYLPFWEPLLLIELVARVSLVMGSALVLALLLRRRRSLPAVYAWLVGIQASFLLATVLIAQQVPHRQVEVVETFLSALFLLAPASAWIPYLFLSDRARSTLIE